MTDINRTALLALARAYDTEEAAQMGEPSPWPDDGEPPTADMVTWAEERLACAQAGIEAYLEALPAAPLPEEVERVVAEWTAAMDGVTPGPWIADQSHSQRYLDAVQFSYQSGSKGTVALVGKDEAQVGASETEEQNANSGWIARCSPDGIRSLLALITQQAQALADANARLPRLTDDMMRAAARAHFASDNIDGIGMTANGIDYSFRQAFTRMWSGIRRSRGGNND